MSRGRTTIEQANDELAEGFGAEFRELARQRRFVRSDVATKVETATDWRSVAASPSPKPAPKPAAPKVAAQPPRLSDDQRAIVRELARMSDQLVDAREQLAATTTRVTHLEAQLTERDEQLRTANDRVLASHLLVQDAQKAAHDMAERTAWLEARCDTLEQALELAVNASWLTRLRWRRQRSRAGDAT